MRHDEAVLLDIDMAARRITGFVQGLTFEQFIADERTWSAVLYQVIKSLCLTLSSPTRIMRHGFSTARNQAGEKH